MIKGISRSMIEVTETGSIYYERAMLIVKPEFASAQHELLEREAKRILGEMGAPSAIQKRKGKLKSFIFAALFTLLGAGTSLLIVLPTI